MARSKVRPGVYRLTADVANPFPNARKRSDWRCRPTWTSNTKFVVEVEPKGVHLRPTGSSRAYLLHDRPSTLNAELNARDLARFTAIAMMLEPAEEDFDSLSARLDFSASDLELFLKYLVEQRVLTVKRLEELFDAWVEHVG
jgi:hypothetical protein